MYHAYRPVHVQEVTIQFDDFVWAEEVNRLDEQIVKVRSTLYSSHCEYLYSLPSA